MNYRRGTSISRSRDTFGRDRNPNPSPHARRAAGGSDEGRHSRSRGRSRSRRRSRSRSRSRSETRDRRSDRTHHSLSPLRGSRSESRHRRDRSADRKRDEDRQRQRSADRRYDEDRRRRSSGNSEQRQPAVQGGKVPRIESKEVIRSVERLRKKITGNLPCPIYVGHGSGEQTVHFVLHDGDGGLLKLPEDQKVNDCWVTVADDLTPRRRELLGELLHPHLQTLRALEEKCDVRVYRISGKIEVVRFQNVTVTDWLRLIVCQQGLCNGYDLAAESAFYTITREASESLASAAARVLVAFRSVLVDPARPRITEPEFFWRHISARQMKTLYERLLEVLLPAVIDRVGVRTVPPSGPEVRAPERRLPRSHEL